MEKKLADPRCRRLRDEYNELVQQSILADVKMREKIAELRRKKRRLDELRDKLGKSRDAHERSEIEHKITVAKHMMPVWETEIEDLKSEIALSNRHQDMIEADYRSLGCHEYFPLEF